MGRPKGRQLPIRVSVALTNQQHLALASLARESQSAVSWVVRRAVAEYLERNCRPVQTRGSRTIYAPEAGNDDGTGEHEL